MIVLLWSLTLAQHDVVKQAQQDTWQFADDIATARVSENKFVERTCRRSFARLLLLSFFCGGRAGCWEPRNANQWGHQWWTVHGHRYDMYVKIVSCAKLRSVDLWWTMFGKYVLYASLDMQAVPVCYHFSNGGGSYVGCQGQKGFTWEGTHCKSNWQLECSRVYLRKPIQQRRNR